MPGRKRARSKTKTKLSSSRVSKKPKMTIKKPFAPTAVSIHALGNEVHMAAMAEGLTNMYTPQAPEKKAVVELKVLDPSKTSQRYSRGIYKGFPKEYSILVDEACMPDLKLGSPVGRPDGTSIVFSVQYTTESNVAQKGLLQVEILNTPADVANWQLRLRQYADLVKMMPMGVLSIKTAWMCDSSKMIYSGWFSRDKTKGTGLAAFVLLEIPAGLEYWPLRQFVLSSADLRGSLKESFVNWAINAFSWGLAEVRFSFSGLEKILSDLFLRIGLNPMTLRADNYGVLVNPTTLPSDRFEAPIIGCVLGAIPPIMENLRGLPAEILSQREVAVGVTYLGIWSEICGGIESDTKRSALFTPEKTWKKMVLTTLAVIIPLRAAEAALSLMMAPATATGMAASSSLGSIAVAFLGTTGSTLLSMGYHGIGFYLVFKGYQFAGQAITALEQTHRAPERPRRFNIS